MKKELPYGGYTLKAMRRAFAYAEIDDDLFQLMQDANARYALRAVLTAVYLPAKPKTDA